MGRFGSKYNFILRTIELNDNIFLLKRYHVETEPNTFQSKLTHYSIASDISDATIFDSTYTFSAFLMLLLWYMLDERSNYLI